MTLGDEALFSFMPRAVILERSDVVNRCIGACKECRVVCTETTIHCLNMCGKHAEILHVRLMRDRADICEQSENLMLRSSKLVNQACRMSADVCDNCAESCDAFDDQAMKACAQVRRDCLSVCREMADGS